MSLHCDFCGLDFEPTCDDTTCTACPLAQNCGKIACPRCGYAILPESTLALWLKKLRLPSVLKGIRDSEKNK